MLRNGNLPISFQRRAAPVPGARRAERRCRSSRRSTSKAGDRGSSTGRVPRRASARPTDRPEQIAARFVRPGRPDRPPRRLRRRPSRCAGATSRRSAAIAARVAVPLQLAGGLEDRRRHPARLRRRRDAGRAHDWPSPTSPTAARLPGGRRRLAGGRARPATRAAGRLPLAPARATDLDELVGELVGRRASRRFVLCATAARSPTSIAAPSSVAAVDVDLLVAGGVHDLDAIAPPARRRAWPASSSARPLLSGAHRLPAALEAAA